MVAYLIEYELTYIHFPIKQFDSLPKTSTDETNADIAITLSSVQSQVNIISEKIGGVAKQTDVQEVILNFQLGFI